MNSVYIETYGCSANQSHSEAMEGALAENGLRLVKDIAVADAIVINTCIVKTPTENRIRERIKFIVRTYPEKILVITGCAADIGMFKNIAPNAIFISSHDSKNIAKFLLKNAKFAERKIRKNPLVGITEISSGCVGNCAYCIVKIARGGLKSRAIEDILVDVKSSLEDGCREIWITSQDNSCYGLDIGTNLAELLEKISKIKGDFRIRVGMMNPAHVKPVLSGLVKAFKDPKIYKFIHLPVQSGSDKVLKMMKRGYSTKEFGEIVMKFREVFPRITLSTDIIVGFPGESGEDFERTVELVGRIRPDIVNVSKFGSRPGTEAASMKQPDNRTVKQRSAKLAGLVRAISLGKNMEWIGRGCEILVTERGKLKNQFVGRNESYKPVVVVKKGDAMGKTLKIKISEAGQTFLS